MRSLFLKKNLIHDPHPRGEKKLSYLVYGFYKFYDEKDNEY
jgi:hypothetical protein